RLIAQKSTPAVDDVSAVIVGNQDRQLFLGEAQSAQAERTQRGVATGTVERRPGFLAILVEKRTQGSYRIEIEILRNCGSGIGGSLLIQVVTQVYDIALLERCLVRHIHAEPG